MKTIQRLLVPLCLLLLLPATLHAQRYSVGINAVDILSLGTINAEAGVAVAQQWSLHVGAELNPWTWRGGDASMPLEDRQQAQLQARQLSLWGGVRWWPWHVYSGWWAGVDGRYSVYNQGGIFSRATEEGKAYGGGLYGGYSIMLSEWLNLDLGVGAFGGWKTYTSYACPVCGVITEEGGKVFVVPDARVAIQFIF